MGLLISVPRVSAPRAALRPLQQTSMLIFYMQI